MKRDSLPLRLEGDPVYFLAAIDFCECLKLPVTRCTEHQLKAGPWNFYTNGSFLMDGDAKKRGKGLGAFRQAVEEWMRKEGMGKYINLSKC